MHMVSGHANGELLFWPDCHAPLVRKIHHAAINAVAVKDEKVFSVGEDAQLIISSIISYSPLRTFSLEGAGLCLCIDANLFVHIAVRDIGIFVLKSHQQPTHLQVPQLKIRHQDTISALLLVSLGLSWHLRIFRETCVFIMDR